MQKTTNKEGVREIFTRLPFVPMVPIGRKKFFVGLLIIGVNFLIIGIVLGIVFGIASMFLPEMAAAFMQMLVTFAICSYITATWYTKRLIDIFPQINAKKVQITLVTLMAIVNILAVITGILIGKFAGYYSITGETLKPSNLEGVAIISSVVLWTAGAVFFLFLCFKKSGTQTSEVNSRIARSIIDPINTTMKKIKESWFQNSTPTSLLFALFCLVLIFLFYWFQLRPSQIRKECYQEVMGTKSALAFKTYEKPYQSCLIKNGINK